MFKKIIEYFRFPKFLIKEMVKSFGFGLLTIITLLSPAGALYYIYENQNSEILLDKPQIITPCIDVTFNLKYDQLFTARFDIFHLNNLQKESPSKEKEISLKKDILVPLLVALICAYIFNLFVIFIPTSWSKYNSFNLLISRLKELKGSLERCFKNLKNEWPDKKRTFIKGHTQNVGVHAFGIHTDKDPLIVEEITIENPHRFSAILHGQDIKENLEINLTSTLFQRCAPISLSQYLSDVFDETDLRVEAIKMLVSSIDSSLLEEEFKKKIFEFFYFWRHYQKKFNESASFESSNDFGGALDKIYNRAVSLLNRIDKIL